MNRLLVSKNRISRSLRHCFIGVFSSLLFASVVSASEKNEATLYEKDLFAPQVISKIGMGDDRLRSFTSVQKRNLLDAKKTLVSFFRITQIADADLSRFLGRELQDKYKTRGALLDKLLGPETDIDMAVITGFELEKDSTFTLMYYVVLFSEGRFLLREDSAKLKKQGANWKVISMGGLE